MKEYTLIYNPTSVAGKSKDDFEYAQKFPNILGVSYELFQSEHKEHTIEITYQKANDGYRVIAAGRRWLVQ